MPEYAPDPGTNARFLSTERRATTPDVARVGSALSVSVLVHVAGLLLTLFAMSRWMAVPHSTTTIVSGERSPIIWIAQAGGDDGGSGKKTPAPSRKIESPSRDAVIVPVSRQPDSVKIDRPAPEQPVDVPALPTTAGVRDPGVVTALTPTVMADSQGPGIGGHPGDGEGSGNGTGSGRGPGPGNNSGTGGDGKPGGNGVTPPRLIREVKPGYTPDAMRARVQGTVRLQAVVLPDGSVGSAQVIRSLDATFGLDENAVQTVKLWRFVPGTRAGRPVSTLVDVELTFTLR
jgi:TonB family protein